MSAETKITSNSRLLNDIAQEMGDPAWQAGFSDGQAAERETAPDARRGYSYCLGWMTGRYQRHLSVTCPPSLSIH